MNTHDTTKSARPELEHPATAEDVTERPGRHDDRSADERVPGDRPLQGVDRRSGVLADGRQQDADRRGVGVDDERRQACGGEDPADFRGRGRRAGHRATSVTAARPAAGAAVPGRRRASRSRVGSTLSSDAWIRASGGVLGPQRMNSDLGETCCRVRSSGIEPPEPASPTGLPNACSSAVRAAVVARAGGVTAERRRLLGALNAHLGAPRRVGLEVGDQGVELGLRVGAGDDPHRDLRPRLGDEHVRRAGDPRHVDADRADRRVGPQPVGDRAGARPARRRRRRRRWPAGPPATCRHRPTGRS